MSLTLVFSFSDQPQLQVTLCWSWNNRALVSHPMKLVHMALTGTDVVDPSGAPLFTLMCFPSPSRTTWPGTLSGPLGPTELGLSLPNLLLYPPHTNRLTVCAHTHPQHTHNTYKTHHTHTHHHPWHAPGCNILPYPLSPSAWFWPWNPVWPYCLEGPISRNSSDPRNWFFKQLWLGPATTRHVS